MSEAAKKVSALDKLKALSSKKPADAPTADLAGDLGDPAIAGAKRNKNTVTLGLDPSVTEDAKTCAALKAALDTATAQFKVYQAKLRDYGSGKRVTYNDAFKANVTTVQVPFTVEVADGDGMAETPGREEKVVQVICTAKYSVAQDTVLALEKDMGEMLFKRLFEKSEEKVLKPNAEDLFRELLGELGLEGEELENAMERMFDTNTKVKATKTYEEEIKEAPDAIKQILDQAVVRQQPGLKFP
jgi:molybdopterin converting factor small subunit